jgi:hypothetical protein
LETLIVEKGRLISEEQLGTLINYFLQFPFKSEKVKPKKKYTAYLKEAERQGLAFGKKQGMRYYLLSLLLTQYCSIQRAVAPCVVASFRPRGSVRLVSVSDAVLAQSSAEHSIHPLS